MYTVFDQSRKQYRKSVYYHPSLLGIRAEQGSVNLYNLSPEIHLKKKKIRTTKPKIPIIRNQNQISNQIPIARN